MGSTHKLFIVTILVVLTTASMSYESAASGMSHMSLAARLKLEGESPNCWDSLFQLQACTGEVITFFLNGETYLGPSCCRAISVVGKDCWPGMLGSLGFTAEEGDILEGYCDAELHFPPSPSSPILVDHATKVLP